MRFITKPLEFIKEHFKALLFLIIVAWIFIPKGKTLPDNAQNANVARINLYGAILQSDAFLKELEMLERLPNLKGILLVIDSPGGAIAPSVEISEAIKRVNAKIPVVAYAQGAMASGSYLAGVWADSILANKGALLGSIGVIIYGADISGLIDKLGIKEQSLKAGIYKEAGTMMRAWNADEKAMFEELLKEQYTMFVSEVAQARNLKINDEAQFAQGRLLSAETALKLGLVDGVGNVYDAQTLLLKQANLIEAIWYEQYKNNVEILLEKIVGENIALGIKNGILAGFGQFSKIW